MRPLLHVLHVPGADPDRDAMVMFQQEQAEVCLHSDPERTGVMGNWISALECAQGDNPWSFIVQDDAEPLEGWENHLQGACANSPSPILGLTHFGSYGLQALRKGHPYVTGEEMIWGAAVAYHHSIIAGLAEWAARAYQATGYPHDDRLACVYAKLIGVRTAITSRALFDQPVQRSLLGHQTKIRRPAATITNMLGPSYSKRTQYPISYRLDDAALQVARDCPLSTDGESDE